MIKVDFDKFIKDRLWCGWWYDSDPWRGTPHWVFERHPAIRLITVMKLKDARRISKDYNDRLCWDEIEVDCRKPGERRFD